MGEIILGVDPREKTASDYWTKGVHFETVTKWQTLCVSFLLFFFFFLRALHVEGAGRGKKKGEKIFLLHKTCFKDLLNPHPK